MGAWVDYLSRETDIFRIQVGSRIEEEGNYNNLTFLVVSHYPTSIRNVGGRRRETNLNKRRRGST